MNTILIRESNRELAALLRLALPPEEWAVKTTADEGSPLAAVEAARPDIVMIDLDRPAGEDFILAIRDDRAVIIALKMDLNDEMEITALELGADVVFSKPLALDVLRARLQSIMRCKSKSEEPPPSVYVYNGLRVDLKELRVSFNDQPIHLTATEHRLLQTLALNGGRIVTYQQLITAVWNDDYTGNHDLLRSFVSALRRKLGAAGFGDLIETERQIGYSTPRSQGVTDIQRSPGVLFDL